MRKIPQIQQKLCKAVIDENGYITLYTPKGEKIPGIRFATLQTAAEDHPSIEIEMLVKTRD